MQLLAAPVQTFLFLGAAEAAGGLLELIAVNFDHPKRAEHLRQVGRLITGEKLDSSHPKSVLQGC